MRYGTKKINRFFIDNITKFYNIVKSHKMPELLETIRVYVSNNLEESLNGLNIKEAIRQIRELLNLY